MDAPVDTGPDLPRGLRSVERIPGGATLYKVVFGPFLRRPRSGSVSFRDIDESERKPHLAWGLVLGAHALLLLFPVVALIPAEPLDTIPEQGMTVDLVTESDNAAGERTERPVTPGVRTAAAGSTGDGEGMSVLAAVDLPQPDSVPAGEASAVEPPAPSIASGPATPPRRDLPPMSGTAARGNGAVSADEARWEGAILERIQKRKRYPATALAAGEEDDVVLRLVIDREGRLVRAEIAKSRGHSALDAEVLALARRAGPYPRPPASVYGETVSMLVPVEFVVTKAGRK